MLARLTPSAARVELIDRSSEAIVFGRSLAYANPLIANYAALHRRILAED
jgi:hypothetical protein